ncbi:hypothetical protein [Haloimpatiens massiliensis]|nr:hypothetical protein [Haloimpatiens massiliensis]
MPYLFFGNTTNLTFYFAEVKLRTNNEKVRANSEKVRDIEKIQQS